MLVILFISVFEYTYFCFKSVFEYLPHSLPWPYSHIHYLVSTAITKDVDVAKKAWTASIIVRKSRVDMEICCGDGADVLGPIDTIVAGGTGGVEDVDDVGNGVVTTRV